MDRIDLPSRRNPFVSQVYSDYLFGNVQASQMQRHVVIPSLVRSIRTRSGLLHITASRHRVVIPSLVRSIRTAQELAKAEFISAKGRNPFVSQVYSDEKARRSAFEQASLLPS